MSELLHELLQQSLDRNPEREALRSPGQVFSYEQLHTACDAFAGALASAGIARHDRIAIWLDKRAEAVIALFGAALAGAVFVPINPLLKAEQAAYILRDCNVRLLLTTASRWDSLAAQRAQCPDLRHTVLVDAERPDGRQVPAGQAIDLAPAVMTDAEPVCADGIEVSGYAAFLGAVRGVLHRVIDTDMAAILYTSGSTGRPKGVVLSHRNLVAGARSVASYLGNSPHDRLLVVLPLSFDYGLSQLTTAFSVGACAVLHNYLLAADALRVLARERITGLAAVPALWMQLVTREWPAGVAEHLRYFTNSGGAMPSPLLAELRRRAPQAKPFLMYGLTEAFRSTYLSPHEVDQRPTSIGKAIPNAEILVLRDDGSECGPGEPGELVHRGALVSLGYWNDPHKTAERFRPLPGQRPELVLPEMAVWSGDTVKRDEAGFLYFVSRRDEMIKTSGYRVSPTEVEEVLYRTGLVAEAAAFGVVHPSLGEAVVVVAQPAEGTVGDTAALQRACRDALPNYMVPARIDWLEGPLPRNANGKIDRKALSAQRQQVFALAP